MAILGSLEKDVAALYVAIFGRAPEGEGLNYWVNLAQQNNWDLAHLADAMIQAAKNYPGYENIDDPQTLIEALYKNVLGKTYQDDPEGINFWVSKIQEGYDKGLVVEEILKTAIEQYPNDPATKTLLNRVEVALYTAQKIQTADINGDGQIDQNDFAQFQNFATQVTDDPATVQTVEAMIDSIVNKGEEFTLTTKADEIIGTSKDDIINAVISSLSSENTLNSDDKIDGGDGVDTINVDVNSNFEGFSDTGYLKNVEIINLTNQSTIPRTFSAKGIEGAQQYVIDASKAPINLSDLGNLNSEIYLKNQKSGTFTVSYANGVTDGSSDEQKLLIENVGTPDNPDTDTNEEQAVSITINGIENLNLSSVKGDNIVSLSGDSVKNLVVDGEGNIKINTVPTPLETFDASQVVGNVVVDFANASNMNKIVTGDGDDEVTIDISDDVLPDAQIEGGYGNDELVINGSGIVQFKQSGFEKVIFDKTTGNITYSALDANDIQTFAATGNVANNITLANLGAKDYTVELDGANASGATISLDNSGVINLNVTQPSTEATTATPDNNTLGVTAANANALYLTVDNEMQYSGSLQAPKATYLKIDANGQVALGAGSDLSSIEQLEIVSNNNVNISSATLGKVASLNLSGNGSVTLGNLGSNTLDYGITLNASGLAEGLTVGNINTDGANVNIDVSGVSGAVNIGNITTKGTNAPIYGDVVINAQNTLGAITLGNITAKNVTLDATNAINGATYGTITINDGGTLDLKGSQLKANNVTINLAGSNDETIKVVGGIQSDTITIAPEPTAGFTGKASINVTGDLGNDTIVFNGNIDATNGFIFDGVEKIDVKSNTVKVKASDISGKTFTLAGANGGTLDVIGTDTSDTIDLTNITPDSTSPGTITVEAGIGDDIINGSSGNDIINGGAGADTITTGAGTDNVILDAFATADKIQDFASGTDKVKVDVTKRAGSSITNKLAASVYSAANTSKIIVFKESGGKITGKSTIKVTGGSKVLTSKLLYTYSKTINDLVNHIGTKIGDQAANAAATKGVLIVKTAVNNKLFFVGVSDPAGDGNLKAIDVYAASGTQNYITLATIVGGFAAGDIVII